MFLVLLAVLVSAHMTLDTIHERDVLTWEAEQNRERAIFIALKYRILQRKYEEQEKILATCRVTN